MRPIKTRVPTTDGAARATGRAAGGVFRAAWRLLRATELPNPSPPAPNDGTVSLGLVAGVAVAVVGVGLAVIVCLWGMLAPSTQSAQPPMPAPMVRPPLPELPAVESKPPDPPRRGRKPR